MRSRRTFASGLRPVPRAEGVPGAESRGGAVPARGGCRSSISRGSGPDFRRALPDQSGPSPFGMTTTGAWERRVNRVSHPVARALERRATIRAEPPWPWMTRRVCSRAATRSSRRIPSSERGGTRPMNRAKRLWRWPGYHCCRARSLVRLGLVASIRVAPPVDCLSQHGSRENRPNFTQVGRNPAAFVQAWLDTARTQDPEGHSS
jgi:hypothetical protein